jgi:hypothetical protein
MNSTILFVLMMFTFGAVLLAAFLDLMNTRRAIQRGERSAAMHPELPPQSDGFRLTTPH